jgi:phosphotriesterase-related protein
MMRPAILKCATDEPGVTKDVERILRATAQAHRKTGVPISTHTHARRRVGLDQQRIFREEGVDLMRVVIGHSGDTTDLGHLEELIINGSYIGMDRFGIETILSFEDRVKTVADMCKRGHANKMMLSHDALLQSLVARASAARYASALALSSYPQRRDTCVEAARRDRRAVARHADHQSEKNL